MILTNLKKCIVSKCGCGPSDCQNWPGLRLRRASTPQEGLCVETDQDAREDISRRPEREGSWAEGVRVLDRGCLQGGEGNFGAKTY